MFLFLEDQKLIWEIPFPDQQINQKFQIILIEYVAGVICKER